MSALPVEYVDDFDGFAVGSAVVGGVDDARVVALLGEVEPGVLAMTLLRGLELERLDELQRIEAAAAWERQQAWVAAQAQLALAAVTADLSGMAVAEQVKARRSSARTDRGVFALVAGGGGEQVGGRRAAGRGSAVDDASLEAGSISFRHAFVLADAVLELQPDEVAFVEARVIEKAAQQTVAQFTRAVRRAVLAAAPQLAAARHDQAVAGRQVRLLPGVDGMADLIAHLPAVDAETVFLALDGQARKAAAAAKAENPEAPAQPVGAGRADALLCWAKDALSDPDLPRRQGRRAEVQVVIDLPSLLGLADNPAELVGYGPIPAAAACALAGEAGVGWRRLVTDPVSGYLLDYGTDVYRPPQPLKDYLVARDRVCRFPGCRRRADACEIDHVIPFGTPGGATAACNCAALCKRHHHMKTHGGRHLERHDDGALTWTAPNGRTFHVDHTGQYDSW